MRIFRREFLAHNVYRGNRCTLIISKDIQPGKVQALQKADNKHIVIDHSHNPKNVRIAAGLVGLLYLLLLFNSITIQWNLTLAFAHGMFLLALIILILLSIKTPIHQIVFDRTTGLVALPYGFRNNRMFVPFKELLFFPEFSDIEFSSLRIKVPWKYRRQGLFVPIYNVSIGLNANDDWILLQWFMDKNRTLPPGEPFDLYR